MTQHDESSRAPLPTPTSTSSYWHKEPSKLLLGHRTTEELPKVADVVVVGSGIAGTFAAWRLLGADDVETSGEAHAHAHGDIQSVLMLEAREVCWGATGRVGFCLPPSDASPLPNTPGDGWTVEWSFLC
jgi:hypothetical protein